MKYTCNRYLNILLFFAAVASLASCSDEHTLPSPEQPEEMGNKATMTFILNVPLPERVSTRAATDEEKAIDGLHVLVFESAADDALLLESKPFDQAVLTDAGNGKKKFEATLETSGGTERYVCIVANAQEVLQQALQGKEKMTLQEVKQITTDRDRLAPPFVMSGTRQAAIPSLALVETPFQLNRTVAKVTVEGAEDTGIRVESFRLCNGTDTGSILPGGTPDKAGSTTFTETGNSCYSYPAQNSAETPVYLILQVNSRYYRMEFTDSDGNRLSLLPNHHYQAVVTSVSGQGYATPEEASRHPGNSAGTIYDHQPEILNMATDGTAELGVTDTVRIANAEEAAYFYVKCDAGTDAANDDEPTFEVSEEYAYWLNAQSGISEVSPDADERLEPEERGTLRKYRLKVPANYSGGLRTGIITVKWNGLERGIYVKQAGENLLDKLEITFGNQASSTSISNYLQLMEEIFSNSQHPRDKGLHFVVQSADKGIYTIRMFTAAGEYAGGNYTWEVKDNTGGWLKLAGEGTNGNPASGLSGQTFTVQWDQDKYAEMDPDMMEKGLQIVITNTDSGRKTTIDLDIYHTGIFVSANEHHTDQIVGKYQTTVTSAVNPLGWHYYEIVKIGNYLWMDRNLGASSDRFFSRGSVPVGNEAENASGPFYWIGRNQGTNVAIQNPCPAGYAVPTVSQFSDLVYRSAFKQDWQYDSKAGTGYWDARCEVPGWGNLYFPKNRRRTAPAIDNHTDESYAGSEHTGYYWTSTEALGASGDERGHWLQFLNLSGGNASFDRARITESGTGNRVGMSVRCVQESNVQETVYDIEFHVKGYTHIFIFNDPNNGNVDNITYLNTWPGTMIAYDSEDGMYHTFKYSTTVNYQNLRVVFYRQYTENNVTQEEQYGPISYSIGQPDKFFHRGGNNWTSTAE